MKRIVSLLLTFSLTVASIQSAETSFDWRAFVAQQMNMFPYNSKFVMMGVVPLLGVYSAYSGYQNRKKEAQKKLYLLSDIRPYVYNARTFTIEGSADDFAQQAAINPHIIKLLPGQLSGTYVESYEPEITTQRVNYLRDNIWGPVDLTLNMKKANQELCNLTAEAEEYYRFSLLQATLPELLAPAAKAKIMKAEEEKSKCMDSLKKCPIAAADEKTVNDPFDMDYYIYNAHEIAAAEREYIQEGLKKLGFKLLLEQLSDELFDQIEEPDSIWVAACQKALADDYQVPQNLGALVQQKINEAQKARYEEYVPLKFKYDNGTRICKIDDTDPKAIDQIDPTEFFNSKEFRDTLHETVYFQDNDNNNLILLHFQRGIPSSLIYSYTIVKKNGYESVSKKMYGAASPQVQALNRRLIKQPYYDARKKVVVESVQNTLLSLAARDPEIQFVDPRKVSWCWYPFARFLYNNGVVKKLSETAQPKTEFALDKKADQVSGRLPQADVQKECVEWCKKKVELFREASQLNLIVRCDTCSEVVYNFCLAIDSFDKLIKDDNVCDEIKIKRNIVRHNFDGYLKYRDTHDYDTWKKVNAASDKIECHFKAFYNVHEELVHAARNFIDTTDLKVEEHMYRALSLWGVSEDILQTSGFKDAHNRIRAARHGGDDPVIQGIASYSDSDFDATETTLKPQPRKIQRKIPPCYMKQ